jgi:hypothetical protein
MTVACRPAAETRFRGIFPDWSGARPVGWFFAEEMLEARHASRFPTNAEGPDEDVNVYLVHLLAGLARGAADPRVRPGADPLLLPPDPALPRRERAAFYRVNGDHRLLWLGLMDRGDGLRRRRVPLYVGPGEARDRDLAAGMACYAMAANLLEGRREAPAGLVAVLRKLAENFEDYVHVLGVLATRRWGLGARLDDSALAGLLRGGDPAETAVRNRPDPAAPTMDDLLDMLAAWRRQPDPDGEAAVRAAAAALGVDPAGLGLRGA